MWWHHSDILRLAEMSMSITTRENGRRTADTGRGRAIVERA